MKHTSKKLLAAASLVIGLSPLANAGLLSIQGGTAGSLPLSGHDVAETKGTSGYFGANLYSGGEGLFLTFEFLGYEAGWVSEFAVDGTGVFQNKSWGGTSATMPGKKAYATVGANSLLDFAFNVLHGGNAGLGVANGSNVGTNDPTEAADNPYGKPNFFLGYASEDENSVYITLDDGGSLVDGVQIDDDNHDDLVVKVTARVPEPASVALLGLGLVGLGVARRRRAE